MEKNQYNHIVLLGRTGFFGRALDRAFQRDGVQVSGYGSVDLDLRKFEELQKLDDRLNRETALILASALTPEKGATLNVLHDNILMCLNVARYLETHPVGLCVYVSSDAVYPLVASPVTEETAVEPASLYALAKYTGERVLARVSETTGLPLLTLRITALYGPGDTHGSYGPNAFMRSILQGKVVRLFGNGEEQRDHLHVDDAASLVQQLVAVKATGTMNLATGRSRSFADIVEILQKIVPEPFQTDSLPRKAPITHRHFDVTKLFLLVPQFKFTPIEQGLEAYYRSSVQKSQ